MQSVALKKKQRLSVKNAVRQAEEETIRLRAKEDVNRAKEGNAIRNN